MTDKYAALMDIYLDEIAERVPDKSFKAKDGPEQLETFGKIMASPPAEQAALAVVAAGHLADIVINQTDDHSKAKVARKTLIHDLVERLLEAKAGFTASQISEIVKTACGVGPHGDYINYAFPYEEMLKVAGRVLKSDSGRDLQAALGEFCEAALDTPCYSAREHRPKIVKMVEESTGQPFLFGGPWGEAIMDWLEGLAGADRENWTALIMHARGATGKGTPKGNWLAEGGRLVDAIGRAAYLRRTVDWLEEFEFNPDPNRQDLHGPVVKGLIWLAVDRADESLAEPLGRFAERALHKRKGFGPPSLMLGKAAVAGLEAMPGRAGAAELARFRRRVKFPNIAKMLEDSLARIAAREGLSSDAMEEQVLPDFGLGADGRATEKLGDVTAEITLSGTQEVALSWTGADGKPRKTEPASIKADHAEALKALKTRVKDIRERLSVERQRLENLYLENRSWPLAEWRRLYLGHPLLAPFARRLIWRLEEGKRAASILPVDDFLVDAGGDPVNWFSDATRVTLWHPIDAADGEVTAWRQRLALMSATQPFKQAHREIYLVTDAERETGHYSNRFAGHILRQHQFRRLAQSRGWRYGLQGQFDSWNTPERRLDHLGISAAYATDPAPNSPADHNGFFEYLATDRVQFQNHTGGTVSLADLQPVVFSELMRDVDLFVGVASIGSDPTWRDGGPNGRYAQYWTEFSSGVLGDMGVTRRVVLEELLPKLSIAAQCELQDRYMRVRGKRRCYLIHIGSGSIRVEDTDRYVCIVPKKHKEDSGLLLPFEGDEMLSIILSKAFLLAADDKITDRTILSQIGR